MNGRLFQIESWARHWKTSWARTNRSCPWNFEVVYFLWLGTQFVSRGRNPRMQPLGEVTWRHHSSAPVNRHEDLVFNSLSGGKPVKLVSYQKRSNRTFVCKRKRWHRRSGWRRRKFRRRSRGKKGSRKWGKRWGGREWGGKRRRKRWIRKRRMKLRNRRRSEEEEQVKLVKVPNGDRLSWHLEKKEISYISLN